MAPVSAQQLSHIWDRYFRYKTGEPKNLDPNGLVAPSRGCCVWVTQRARQSSVPVPCKAGPPTPRRTLATMVTARLLLFVAAVDCYISHPALRTTALAPTLLRAPAPFAFDITGKERHLKALTHLGKYGGDPRQRHAVPQVDSPFRTWPLGTAGQVSDLYGGIAHLQAVLTEVKDEVVVLKFMRRGCPACGSTIARLADAAVAYAGRALFFEVDFDMCRFFCKQCAIKAVPCVHLYARDELLNVMPLGPSSYDGFAEYLAQIAGPPTLDGPPAAMPAAPPEGESHGAADAPVTPASCAECPEEQPVLEGCEECYE